ncbi:hypothetical protein [Gloeobacter violaceus]|nr:hypothetical protein [Gloeobacter violaceus]
MEANRFVPAVLWKQLMSLTAPQGALTTPPAPGAAPFLSFLPNRVQIQ